jgi:membrane-associated phospholipid phosphatase
MKARIFLLLLGCSIHFSGLQAQGGDYASLKLINPRYPDNPTLKTLSSTTYPICITLPISVMAVSLIADNKKGKQVAYELVGGLIVTAATTGVLKKLVNRPRPYETYDDIYPDVRESGNSFPSGHTALAFSTATTLLLTTEKWYYAAPAYVWAMGVGYSRIYLGQHYPSDVIAGAITGAAGAYLTHIINKKWLHPVQKKTVQIP